MHRLCKFGLVGYLCFWSIAGLASGMPAAPITEVLLFPGGATITRTVHVSDGMTQAVIAGVPSRFDLQTLRTEASAGIHVGEILSSDTARTEAVNPAEADLEAKIADLQDKQNALDADAKSAQLVIDYLGRLGGGDATTSPGRQPPPMDGKTLSQFLGVMGGEASKSFATLLRVAVEQRAIGKKIDALQRDLSKLRTGTKDTRTLTIKLRTERPGTVKVSYQVNNAGWKPAYRASLNSEKSTLDLERRAIISQKTGEDWTNVRLRLSTNQPRQAITASEPRPWLLSYSPPEPPDARERRAAFAPAPLAAPMAMPALTAGRLAAEPAYVPPTFETQSMFATEYQVPAPTSLPADGREVSVALANQDIAVTQYLQTTPRLEAAAYVTVEADRPQGDWPGGDMQLYRDGNYVGSRYWNPQDKDHLVLGFGRDDQVHVALLPVKSDSGSGGVFEKRRQKQIANTFSITNQHSRPMRLTILEASPVATSDEIKVRVAFEPKPSQEAWEDKRGVVAWDITLAPNQTSRIKTAYEIEFPNEGRLAEQR